MDSSQGSQPLSPRHIPVSEAPPLPIAEIPRGSVSARLAFFEGLAGQSACISPRDKSSDRVFAPLSQVEELGPQTTEELEGVPEDEISHETPAISMLNDPGFSTPRGHKVSGGDQAAGIKETAREADVDAVCINCQEYIGIEDMDDHSYMCANVQPQPSTLQEETTLKIRKLHRGINRRIKVSHGERLLLLQRMREITLQITKHPNGPLTSFNQELHELATEALSIKSGISCAIFARRLASLILEKELLLEAAITEAEGIVETEKQDLVLWQVRPNVSAIASDLGKNSEATSSRLSLAKSEDDIADLQAVDDVIKQTSEEQQKRYFYSICLKQKLLLPKRHPRQKALVSSLYEEAMRQTVPPGQWERFIAESLSREEI